MSHREYVARWWGQGSKGVQVRNNRKIDNYIAVRPYAQMVPKWLQHFSRVHMERIMAV